MTVSVWLKICQCDQTNQAILGRSDNGWRLERSGEQDTIRFVLTRPKPETGGRTNLVSLVSKRSVDDGRWHHVIAAYDSHSVTLYLDGNVEDSALAAGQILRGQGATIVIGENMSDRRRYFNGWIDELRLYGYGLDREQTEALYRLSQIKVQRSRSRIPNELPTSPDTCQ